jgi:putative two-component system response regulator
MQKTIFIVDDNDTNLLMAKEVLKDKYRVMTLPSATRMFALIQRIRPDLVLLDIEMPGINGWEALDYLKGSASQLDIPVIFLTGVLDAEAEAKGFELGVVDFITKPFSAPVLLNRIKTHLEMDDIIRDKTAELRRRTMQLQRLQNAIIFGFADMVESRDHGTGGHIERTSRYVKILAEAMMVRDVYAGELKDVDMEQFVSSARLHDIGKIAIPDAILNKPDKLTEEEYEVMKRHATEGERVIEHMILRAKDDEFFLNAKLFAGYHHERWDGKGYPRGLKGVDIPLPGRIMAVVDVYDALTSARPYKEPHSHEDAVKAIRDGSGSLFDPLIANVFYEAREQFKMVKA